MINVLIRHLLVCLTRQHDKRMQAIELVSLPEGRVRVHQIWEVTQTVCSQRLWTDVTKWKWISCARICPSTTDLLCWVKQMLPVVPQGRDNTGYFLCKWENHGFICLQRCAPGIPIELPYPDSGYVSAKGAKPRCTSVNKETFKQL